MAQTNDHATAPAEARHVVVLVNPRAGRRDSDDVLGQLVYLLGASGYACGVYRDLPSACERATRLHTAGELRALVTAGGDGTIAAAVNRTPAGLPIAPLPFGTENLLARHFGITCDAAHVAELIRSGVSRRLDVGRATGRDGSRLFLLMASAGLDAEVIRRLHERRSGHISHWSYIGPIVESIWRYKYPALRVTRDARSPEAARWAVAFNLPCYAGGLRFLEECDGSDGRLDVCRFAGQGFWTTLYYYLCLALGRWSWIKGRGAGHARTLILDSAAPAPYQLDGDPGGYLPVQLDVLPGRLTLLIPPVPAPLGRL